MTFYLLFYIIYLIHSYSDNYTTISPFFQVNDANLQKASKKSLHIAKLLGDFERKNVFNLYHIVSAELTGEAVIKGILNIVIPKVIGYKTAKDDNRIFEFLPHNMIQLIHQECGLYDPEKNEEFIYQMEHIPTYWRLRLVVDWIAGMTDKYALETYQRLSGMKLT